MIKKNRLFYERYIINDFTESEMKKLKRNLTAEDINIINELKKHNQELYQKYPLSMIKEKIRNKLKQQNIHKNDFIREFMRSFKFIVPVFACFILIIAGAGMYRHFNKPSIRMKGENHPSFYIYQKTEQSYKQVYNNSIVKAGDVLQISYNSDTTKKGSIFSVDGYRNITYHFPLGKSEMTSLNTNDNSAEIVLPYSYEIDDAPDFEIFFFITAEKNLLLNNIIKEIIQSPDIKNFDITQYKDINIQTIILLKGDK